MSLIRFLLSPAVIWAATESRERHVVLTTGIRIPVTQVIGNITGFVAVSAVAVCTLLFLIGAAMLTAFGSNETQKGNAKNLMKQSLIGLGLVGGSYGIIRTVLYFLYEGA